MRKEIIECPKCKCRLFKVERVFEKDIQKYDKTLHAVEGEVLDKLQIVCTKCGYTIPISVYLKKSYYY